MSAILDVKTLIERYDRPVLQRTRAVYDRIGVVVLRKSKNGAE